MYGVELFKFLCRKAWQKSGISSYRQRKTLFLIGGEE